MIGRHGRAQLSRPRSMADEAAHSAFDRHLQFVTDDASRRLGRFCTHGGGDMVQPMRVNFNPRSTLTAHRAWPASVLVGLILAGCGTSVPLPPMPPISSAPSTPLPAPAPPVAVDVPPPAPAPVREPQLAAFSTRLDGRNQVPPVHSMGTGTIDGVLNRETGRFQWQISFSNLSGPVTAMHIQGPADIGSNAAPLISFNPPFDSPWRGELMLTPAQRAELLAGRWYLSIYTARHPTGELRGQLIERR